MESFSWPLRSLSPRDVLWAGELVTSTLLQGATGMLFAMRVASLAAPRTDQHTAYRTIRPIAWATVIVACAWWWLLGVAEPATRQVLIDALTPWLWGGAIALVVVALSTTFASKPRDGSTNEALGWLVTGAAVIVLATWSWLLAFRLTPGPWLELRTYRAAANLPTILPIIALQTAMACFVGSWFALFWSSTRPESDPPSRRIADTASWLLPIGSIVGVGLWVSAPVWIPPVAMPSSMASAMERGNWHASWPSRWMVVGIAAWATGSLTVAALRRVQSWRTPRTTAVMLALSVVASSSLQGWLGALTEPWGIRGLVYANGVTVEGVRTHRRSSVVGHVGEEPLGRVMFRMQCMPCHARDGAGSIRKRFVSRSPNEVRAWLEALREADRPGQDPSRSMPPLVGSDVEIDALGQWLLVRHE